MAVSEGEIYFKDEKALAEYLKTGDDSGAFIKKGDDEFVQLNKVVDADTETIESAIYKLFMKEEEELTHREIEEELPFLSSDIRKTISGLHEDGYLTKTTKDGVIAVYPTEWDEPEEPVAEPEPEPEPEPDIDEPKKIKKIGDFVKTGRDKYRVSMEKEDEDVSEEDLDDVGYTEPKKEWVQKALPLRDLGLPKKKPDWASIDAKPSEEVLDEEIPICWIKKRDIREFGTKVIGDGDREGLNQSQYDRVRKGMEIYREGRVSRIDEKLWKVISREKEDRDGKITRDIYLIGLRDGEYVHLDNKGRYRDWGQRKDKNGSWCKHIVAVHIARSLDCEVDMLDVDKQIREDLKWLVR